MSHRVLVLLLALTGCRNDPPPPADAPCDAHLRHAVSQCWNTSDGGGCRMVAWASYQTCTLERHGVVFGPPPAEAPEPTHRPPTIVAPR